MCGRCTYYPGAFSDLRIGFNLPFGLPELKQRFNISPGQEAPVIAAKEEGNCLEMFRWGLIPSWVKSSIRYKKIDARSETVATNPVFKRLIGKRHCLVLANGFFEWRKQGKKRVPMHFKLKSGQIFTFPGLWDSWKQPDGNILHTYTLLTTKPNELVRPIHDRMPVIWSEDAAKQWLDPIFMSFTILSVLMQPFPSELMEAYEVSRLVNDRKNDSPACIDPAIPEPPGPLFDRWRGN